MTSVTIILLNWNSAGHTIPCIESLLKSDFHELRVIVVDNGSTDDSADAIEARFSGTSIIRLPEGVAMAAARNIGIRLALEGDCSHLMMIDNDTRADPGMISRLVATCEHRGNTVAATPKIYWMHDPGRIWFAQGRLNLWTGLYSDPAYKAVDRGQFDREKEIEIASTCCIMIPRHIAERVQFHDTLYYNDDVEWSLRCRRTGFRIIYCPEAKLWHWVGGGESKNPSSLLRYLWTRDQFRTLRMHARPLQMASIILCYPLRGSVRVARMVKSRQWACIRAELKGLRDGLLAPLETNGTNRSRARQAPAGTVPRSPNPSASPR